MIFNCECFFPPSTYCQKFVALAHFMAPVELSVLLSVAADARNIGFWKPKTELSNKYYLIVKCRKLFKIEKVSRGFPVLDMTPIS